MDELTIETFLNRSLKCTYACSGQHLNSDFNYYYFKKKKKIMVIVHDRKQQFSLNSREIQSTIYDQQNYVLRFNFFLLFELPFVLVASFRRVRAT